MLASSSRNLYLNFKVKILNLELWGSKTSVYNHYACLLPQTWTCLEYVVPSLYCASHSPRPNSDSTCWIMKLVTLPPTVRFLFLPTWFFSLNHPLTHQHIAVSQNTLWFFSSLTLFFPPNGFWVPSRQKMYFFQVPTDLPTLDTVTQKYW